MVQDELISSKIAPWFDENIKKNPGYFPFDPASAETSIKVDKSTYFSDIIIWKNHEAYLAYSYIEIKPPFGTTENFERFRKKAVGIFFM